MSTIREQYEQAKLAYHKLRTGTAPLVVVDQNGERVEFNRANRADLKAYIDELAGMLGELGSTNRKPMRLYF